MTDQKKLIQLTSQLVAIESTHAKPHNLVKAYQFVFNMIKNSGKQITIEQFERKGFRSLLAYKGPTRPDKFHVILNGHLDVVTGKPEAFNLVEKNGNLYGRGVYDMKGAAVIMTDVFCEFVDKVPYPLALQIVTDEELGGYNGTAYQVEQGVRSDFVICGECGGVPYRRGIANQAKGIAWVNIGFRGSSAHAGHLWRGDNAVVRASRFAQAILDKYPTPSQPEYTTTVNVAAIESGPNNQNQVPDYALLKLDIRFTAQDQNFQSRRHLTGFMKQIDPNLELEIAAFDAPYYADPENQLLIALKQAAEKIEQTPFELFAQHGSSDARFYGNFGNQACEFGIAGEGQHEEVEYVSKKAFQNYHQTLHTFLQDTTSAHQQ